MDNVYTYLVNLPANVKEVVTPCEDGYTVYIADRLSRTERIKAYIHALKHIQYDDFAADSVQSIEVNNQCGTRELKRENGNTSRATKTP